MVYLILIISLVGIVYGADLLVAGSSETARRFKVSDFVIGAAIVGIGTSMPELTVSVLGAIKGNADIAIGNVVGSNIFNILGILGLTAALFPIAVSKSNLKFEIPLCIGISVILTVLAFNFFTESGQVIGRLDGLALLLLFIGFMWYSFKRDRKQSPAETENNAEKDIPLWKSILKICIGLPLLIISCDFFVDEAVVIARNFGLNDAFISITLIACGTSLPELAASITAAFKKNTQLALGNVVGSNIFNASLILGLSSQVTPLTSCGITLTDYLVMIGAAVMTMIFGLRGKIGRIEGIAMFLCFVIYNIYCLLYTSDTADD